MRCHHWGLGNVQPLPLPVEHWNWWRNSQILKYILDLVESDYLFAMVLNNKISM